MLYAYLFMLSTVALSNYLVLFPINDWLTWGAFPYPLAFFITELTNYLYGPKAAKKVVYLGFIWGILLSFGLSTPKVALASGTAFLSGQLLDVAIFTRLRAMTWWYAPLTASALASVVDSTLFWPLAFWQEDVPLISWALGDFSIKLLLDLILLTPFRWLINTQPLFTLKP